MGGSERHLGLISPAPSRVCTSKQYNQTCIRKHWLLRCTDETGVAKPAWVCIEASSNGSRFAGWNSRYDVCFDVEEDATFCVGSAEMWGRDNADDGFGTYS